MEVLQPLNDFYEAIGEDPRIGATHISLYMALLYAWNLSSRENPFQVPRDQVMSHARMSRKTYHKCIRELHQGGYIRYEPATRPFAATKVYIKELSEE